MCILCSALYHVSVQFNELDHTYSLIFLISATHAIEQYELLRNIVPKARATRSRSIDATRDWPAVARRPAPHIVNPISRPCATCHVRRWITRGRSTPLRARLTGLGQTCATEATLESASTCARNVEARLEIRISRPLSFNLTATLPLVPAAEILSGYVLGLG